MCIRDSRKPYLEPSTYSAYEIDGRKRMLPVLGALPLSGIGVDQVRNLIADLAELVEAGEVSAKTVNNTLGTLVAVSYTHLSGCRCCREP